MTTVGQQSEQDSQPPVSTKPPVSEAEYNPPPNPLGGGDVVPVEEIDWNHRKEIYLLDNGATVIARNEIEAGAYKNKGGKLVDVVYDE